MRRATSALLLMLALLVGSAALVAHVLSTVVVDADRPGRALAELLESERGRDLAAEMVVDRVRSLAPELDPGRAEAIAEDVAADARLRDALRSADGGDAAQSRVLDKAIDALERRDPALAAQARSRLPADAGADLRTLLPRDLVERAGSARKGLTVLARRGALAAAALAAGAVLVGPRRDRLVRWLGAWCLGWSALGVLGWLLAPRLLAQLDGAWPLIVTAGLQASAGDLLRLLAALLGAGILALVVAYAAGGPHRTGRRRRS